MDKQPVHAKIGTLLLAATALVAALGAAAAAAESPPVLERRIEVVTPAVLVGEPVILKITYRNASTQTVDLRDEALQVSVQAGGGVAARTLYLVKRPRPLTAIEPGQVHTRKAPVILGRPEAAETSPAEWVFPTAGRYGLAVAGAEAAPMVVTVADVVAPEDLAARDLWTLDVAAGLVAESERHKTAMAALDRMTNECPAARLAAYALWVRADDLARGATDQRDYARAAGLCETLLDRYPDFALREETFKALVGIYQAYRQGVRARTTAEDFARAFPESEHVVRLRKAYGDAFGGLGPARDLPAVGAPVARAEFTGVGMELLPAGVRPAFEAFWQAVAAGDLAAVEALLARDFVSDAGDRGEYLRSLWRQRKGATAGQIQVSVAKATPARSYARPATMPAGDARTYAGTLYVIEGGLATGWARPPAVVGMTVQSSRREAPKTTWVLCGYPDGKWRLVSEVALTRNLSVGQAAQRLFHTLPEMFPRWKRSDGERERCPYEEIKAELGLTDKVFDGRTEWKSYTVIMVGGGDNEVKVDGHLRMLLKPEAAGGAKEQWVDRDVTVMLTAGPDETLLLKSVSSRPAAPPRPGPTDPVRQPPPTAVPAVPAPGSPPAAPVPAKPTP